MLRYEPDDYDEDGYFEPFSTVRLPTWSSARRISPATRPNPPNERSLNHPMGIMLDYFDNLVVVGTVTTTGVLIFRYPLSTACMPAPCSANRLMPPL